MKYLQNSSKSNLEVQFFVFTAIEDMQKKFEEDKQKVVALKQKRNFRPL